MTTPSGAAVQAGSTVAGRPQPQTTNEPAGGPFIRHAQSGRRPMYSQNATPGLFFGPPMVSSPGWNKGYRIKWTSTTAAGTGGVIITTGPSLDPPSNIVQLLQLKDAWGTNLLAGPGWDMMYWVQKISGQFGLDSTRDPRALPAWTGITAASGAFVFTSYLPFEFTKGYGCISGANAALLPVLQMQVAPLSNLFSTSPSVAPVQNVQNDADFYWLPNVPVDPPGIGTTCQYIFQPCNPTIPSGGSLRVQLPRLGGFLTVLGLELRDSTNARPANAFPARPQVYVDGVPLLDTDVVTWQEDIAIQTDIGAGSVAGTQVAAATGGMGLDQGTLLIDRKISLAQRDFGLLDTGEVFLSTNPGTQIEINGTPWGTISNAPATLNAVIGQVVPSGPLVQGLPEV
jgi:hypothetical protein